MYFDKHHRLGSDVCWVNAQNDQSKSIHDYNMFNFYKTNVPECKEQNNKLKEFVVENNLHMKEGYGFTNSCLVDNDSMLRNKQTMTQGKCKNQLDTRLFHAVPDMSHGGFKAVIESKLTQGQDTGEKKSCDVLSGKGLDVFTPLIPCLKESVQNHNNIVPKWVRGGEHTRDHLKQKDYLKNNGYYFDGKVWRKKNCDAP